ncbi:hypothetical protein AB0368_24105 [Actinoplanes sp. NPDC051475]|uniref:hypothetical protein n=1 Tax=Actinoplanes sp. NPDC051475 TaxID=3157225 RepID=UPI003450CBFE
MNDNEYTPDLDRRPHTQLDRHFTSGGNTYQVTASGTGDERIRLTVTGWDPGGEVVSEISGGILPADLLAVADALTSTLTGLAALRARGKPPVALKEKPKRYPNRGARWSPEDDERLVARYREGVGFGELMEEFGRSRGGIRARLESLGEIAVEEGSGFLARFGPASGKGSPGGPPAKSAESFRESPEPFRESAEAAGGSAQPPRGSAESFLDSAEPSAMSEEIAVGAS